MAAGLLTAALTLAAHAVGGGATPAGPAAIQLLVVAVTVGVLAARVRRAAEVPVMLGLLAAGQLVGHLILAAAGHSHHPGPAPWSMTLAHLVAIGSGAVLISVGDRLCRALSRVVRAATRRAEPPTATPYAPQATCADQPLRWRLLLAASMSYRGPPVSSVR